MDGRGMSAERRSIAESLGEAVERARGVRFLAGPGARYVTGQEWHVNGGAYLG